ncbi:hypothetical protein LAD77_01795 [Klebsiella pneumoniae]|nr:hypothetical protein [Klebsiella pneumoniae]
MKMSKKFWAGALDFCLCLQRAVYVAQADNTITLMLSVPIPPYGDHLMAV